MGVLRFVCPTDFPLLILDLICQVRGAAQYLRGKLRIAELTDDKAWRPGWPKSRLVETTDGSKWGTMKNTVSGSVGLVSQNNRVNSILKKLKGKKLM